MGNLRYFIIFSITLALVHVTKTEILADGIYTDLVLDAVTLKYYTPQKNGGEVIDILNVTKFHSPGYVVVYCHGYLANPEHDSIAPILHSLVSTGKYNVIAIDWSLAAKSLYNISRSFIGPVGKIAFDILSEVFTLKSGISHEYALDTVDELVSKTEIIVIIHGYHGNRFHSSIVPLRNAYMAQGKENIFLADWQSAASFDYATSRGVVAKVGVFLAKLLENFLNKHDIPLTEVHIIGHSLGAHIAGNMGRYFNGTVGRITGLDPALPLFTPNATDGLHSNAAQFVDVIHTDYPVFGDITPRGTADFYPNYGHVPQKGCDDVNLITASKLIFEAFSCSHNRAVILYAESIGLPQNFPAIPCSLTAIQKRAVEFCLRDFKDETLTKSSLADAIADTNSDGIAYMGEGVSKSAAGLYYLETYEVPPYGMGLYTQIH